MGVAIDCHKHRSGGNGRHCSTLKKLLLSEIETVSEIAFPRYPSVKERRKRTCRKRQVKEDFRSLGKP